MMNILRNGKRLMPAYQQILKARFITTPNIFKDNLSNSVTENQSKNSPPSDPAQPIELKRPLTNFDRKVLVWSGKYKSADEIPPNVPHDTLDRARDRFRVKVCIYMMFGTLVGCIIMIMSGKRAAQRGESVSRSNIEWHREYNAAAAAKEAAKAK